MELIWPILIGLVAGKLAKMLIPGSAPGVLFLTITLGIAGSVAATHVGQFIVGIYATGRSAGLVAAVIGAVVGASALLWAHRFIVRK